MIEFEAKNKRKDHDQYSQGTHGWRGKYDSILELELGTQPVRFGPRKRFMISEMESEVERMSSANLEIHTVILPQCSE